jgi:hypothetical protein
MRILSLLKGRDRLEGLVGFLQAPLLDEGSPIEWARPLCAGGCVGYLDSTVVCLG